MVWIMSLHIDVQPARMIRVISLCILIPSLYHPSSAVSYDTDDIPLHPHAKSLPPKSGRLV
jgi:hypothetical protein